MGPKVKKPAKNAFSFFLDDYVESQRKSGRHVSHKIAAEECGPLWKNLSEEEKEKYCKLATAYKTYSKSNKCNKFTSTGISYAELEKQQEELRVKTEKADSEIKMTISNLDSELLKTQLFYMIHCNYYCKTSEGIYVPGELAIVEFNLGDGIRRTYHTLINPGPIPLGYAFEAKHTIEEIHGLPYPPYDEGDSDYFGILNNILDFLEPGKLPNGRYPPLYCIENNIKASENILKELSENQGEDKNFFRVFLLHKMFFWLKNKCVEYLVEENIGFPVMSNAESEITKDMFCYVPGISCAFHETSEDKYHSCSLSVVQRFVYIICDHCCQYVDVDLIPGKHCRLKTDKNRKATLANLEKAAHRKPSTVASEFDCEGQSSYTGPDDLSISGWRSIGGGSFLHDEIESKFSALEISSVSSRCSRNVSTPACSAGPSRTRARGGGRMKEEENTWMWEGDEDERKEDEDLKKMVFLGRGTHRQ